MSRKPPETPIPETSHGKEQFEAIGADPSLDLAMRKDPREITDDDLQALVDTLRRERAFRIPAPTHGKG